MTDIVAIDGPAGSGKSSVAKSIARELGFLHVDTGAIYRSLAYAAMKAGISLEDPKALANLALSLQEINSSLEIRTEQMGNAASQISQYSEVRANLLELQRRFGRQSKTGAVLEGRDIGTVVFPNAKYKFFLTASAEQRAKRRLLELEQRGEKADYAEILQDLTKRDERDKNRAAAPLVAAKDAILIDTSECSLEQVVEQIKNKICLQNQPLF
ncbi:MAG: (d)CMP kinase [Myxococcaceae bacterium]